MPSNVASIGARIILSATLAAASVGKLLESDRPPESAAQRTVSRELAPPGSWRYFLIVGLEIGCALWLIAGTFPRGSAFASLILLSSFTGIIAVEITNPQPRPCGCFGMISKQVSSEQHVRTGLLIALGRNLALMALASWLYMSRRDRLPACSGTAPDAHPSHADFSPVAALHHE
jgi:uncharacterized membrane protein YphA (DoxX/SURF4 family)